MNARRVRLCALAVVLLAACGGEGGAAGEEADTTQPPATSEVPQAALQTQLAPGSKTPDPPPAPTGPVPGERTYAECEAEARGKPEGEREVLLRTCASLPGAPQP
jgi:hypothetical protein